MIVAQHFLNELAKRLGEVRMTKLEQMENGLPIEQYSKHVEYLRSLREFLAICEDVHKQMNERR